MEIVDELTTPGCPQCAIKHMSAAIAFMAEPYANDFPVAMSQVWLAVAKINLVEVMAGYKSHLWYAVGMLVRSEEAARAEGDSCVTARAVRLVLELKGLSGVEAAIQALASGTLLPARVQAEAHLYEAARELPGLLVYPLIPEPEYLLREIERVREEYFITEEAPAASDNSAEKGGESEMAKKTAKKAPAFLKKEDPKAKQAACKGGKSKGKKCK